MSATTASPTPWTGADPRRGVLVFLLGLLLYFGLPKAMPLPPLQAFRGSAATQKLMQEAAPAPLGAPAETQAKAAAKATQAEATRAQDWRRALHLLAIFATTIVGIILAPLPMGSIAMAGITLVALTGTLGVADAFSGFNNKTIWLIGLAFFIARGFINTGLGSRLAYAFVALLGKRTLGLAYGLIGADLLLAPAIPSNTARTGGIVYPILRALSSAFGSEPDDGTARRMGSFLTLAVFQGTVITSAMFHTSMAANPLAADLANKSDALRHAGLAVTWAGWAKAALVPGLVCLLLNPWLLFRLHPPEVKATEGASEMAREKLAAMGSMKRGEWVLVITFLTLIGLWIFEKQVGVDNTIAAMVGLGMLQITGVVTWKDVLHETGAWDTIVWFSGLVMMADFLSRLGLVGWFSQSVAGALGGHGWLLTFVLLALVYLYSHYAFASATAHVGAMYAAFLGVAVLAGTPPLLAALVLGFFSNLMGGMTPYGFGPAPVLFGSGYVGSRAWWGFGFLFSATNILIWLAVGLPWWKALGLW